jgi:hypothetical protein
MSGFIDSAIPRPFMLFNRSKKLFAASTSFPLCNQGQVCKFPKWVVEKQSKSLFSTFMKVSVGV